MDVQIAAVNIHEPCASELLHHLDVTPPNTTTTPWCCYLWEAVGLLELRDGVGPHIVAHLLPGFYGSLHKPLAGDTTTCEHIHEPVLQ